MARRQQRGSLQWRHKSKAAGRTYSSEDIVACFDDIMTDPKEGVAADSGCQDTSTTLYNQHKHPGEFTRKSLPSIKKRRTDDVTDLTGDCDEGETPYSTHQQPVLCDPLAHSNPSTSRRSSQRGRETKKTKKISDFAHSAQQPPLLIPTRSATRISTDYIPSMASSLPGLPSKAATKRQQRGRPAKRPPHPAHGISDPTHCTISTFSYDNTSSRPAVKNSFSGARTKVVGESLYRGSESQSHVGSDDVFIVEQEETGSRSGSRGCLVTASPSKRGFNQQEQNTAKSQKPDSTHPGGSTHYPSGSTHYPSSSTHYPSGSTHYSSGSTNYPSGSTHYPSSSTHYPSGSTPSYGHLHRMAEPDSSPEWNDQCLGLESETSVPALDKTGCEGEGGTGMGTRSKQKEIQTLSDDEDMEEGLSPLQMVSVGLGASAAGGNKEQRAQRPSSESTKFRDPVDVMEVDRDVEKCSSCEYVCTTSEYFEPQGASSGSGGSTSVPQRHGPDGSSSPEAVLGNEEEFKLELEWEEANSPIPVSEDKSGKEQSFEDLSEVSCIPDSLESEAPEPPVAKDHLKPESTFGAATPSELTESELLSPDSEVALNKFKRTCETFDESSQRKFVAPLPAPPPLISISNSTAYSSRLRSSAGRTASDTGLDDHAGAKRDGQRRAVRLRGADSSHMTSASSGLTSAGSIEVEFDFDETLQGRKGPVNPFAIKGATKMKPSLTLQSSREQAKVPGPSVPPDPTGRAGRRQQLQEAKGSQLFKPGKKLPTGQEDRQRRVSDDEVIFQGEESRKTYPLRNQPSKPVRWVHCLHSPKQRDYLSEILEPDRLAPSRNENSLTRRPLASNSGTFYKQTESYKEMIKKAAATQQRNESVGDVFSCFGKKSLKLKKKDQHFSSKKLCIDRDSQRAGSSRPRPQRKLRPIPCRGDLDDLDDQETVELEVVSAQIGRLTDIGVIDSVKLGGNGMELNLDVDDRTHKMQFEMKDIKEWKMNLSREPLVIFLLLTSGKALQISRIFISKFYLESSFYCPGSLVLSEKYLVLHFSSTPNPMTIVKLTEALNSWQERYKAGLDVQLDKEMPPPEAVRLLEQVRPAKPARTEGKLPQGLLPGATGMDNGKDQPIRRSTRLSKRQGQGGARRGKSSTGGDPNKKLLTYQPPGRKLRLELTSGDVDCLLPGEYLNDRIIDFYLLYLWHKRMSQESHEKVHVFSSFFHNRLTDSSRDNKTLSTPERIHDRVRTWTRHVDLFNKDFIVLPVCDRAHWFVSVIVYPGRYSPELVGEGSRSRARAGAKKGRGWGGRRGRRKAKGKVKTPEGAIVLSGSSPDDVVTEFREESVEREGSEVDGEPIAAVTEEGDQRLDHGYESPGMVDPSGECDERNGTGASDDQCMDWVETEHSRTIPEDSIPGALLQSAREGSTGGLSTPEAIASERLEGEITSEDERLLLSNSEEDPSLLSNSHPLDLIEADEKQGCGSENEEPYMEHMDSDPSQMKTSREAVVANESSEDESPLSLGSKLLDTDSEHSQAETDRLAYPQDRLVSDDGTQPAETIHPCIMVLDSLGVKRTGIVKRIRNYLTAEWKAKKPELPPKNFDGMKPFYPSVPLQDNSSDCGVFLLEYVESLITSLTDGKPLPSSSKEWASYDQTRTKREEITDLIKQLCELQQPGAAVVS